MVTWRIFALHAALAPRDSTLRHSSQGRFVFVICVLLSHQKAATTTTTPVRAPSRSNRTAHIESSAQPSAEADVELLNGGAIASLVLAFALALLPAAHLSFFPLSRGPTRTEEKKKENCCVIFYGVLQLSSRLKTLDSIHFYFLRYSHVGLLLCCVLRVRARVAL